MGEENRGPRLADVLVIVVCAAAAMMFLRCGGDTDVDLDLDLDSDSGGGSGQYFGPSFRARPCPAVRVSIGRDAARVRCANNLRQLSKAMCMYFLRYGDNCMYPIPAHSFRGDAWLATLYWAGLIDEPSVFRCPGTHDDGRLPRRPPRNLAAADAVEWDAVSYAGLCKGLTRNRHRNTYAFVDACIAASVSAMACDDNEGSRNHPHGLVLVYFDSHVEFKAPGGAETYDRVGTRGAGALEYLDSGE